MREAVGRIELEIENLRSIITELRPAALDELGLRAAIETLLTRQREQTGLVIDSEIELVGAPAPDERLPEAVEIAVYRLIQEALTNVAKHAHASHVRVEVRELAGELKIEVADDGGGFDPDTVERGFGLQGMQERVLLAGGTLEVGSSAAGTRVRASLPARRGRRAQEAILAGPLPASAKGPLARAAHAREAREQAAPPGARPASGADQAAS
jgi:signal transduction histidine kinase